MPPSSQPPQNQHQAHPAISATFTNKKHQILSSLRQNQDSYTDNSPKGSVDVQIRHLIDEINQHEGLVTTSSCAGRVAVFVEGGAGSLCDDDEDSRDGVDGGRDGAISASLAVPKSKMSTTTTSPGGKGGGRWLYVSHDPIPVTETGSVQSSHSEATQSSNPVPMDDFTELFNLAPASEVSTTSSGSISPTASPNKYSVPTRLIHLTFSPLILHIYCATLRHARPLLAAAINAGFRESGVQSLKILDEPDSGVMVAVRTTGLSFETIVGTVVPSDGGDQEEVMQSVVDEKYLGMCVGVVNERFRWNDERRERFRRELKSAMEREGAKSSWETKEERSRRKKEEGLSRQRNAKEGENNRKEHDEQMSYNGFDQGLSGLATTPTE